MHSQDFIPRVAPSILCTVNGTCPQRPWQAAVVRWSSAPCGASTVLWRGMMTWCVQTVLVVLVEWTSPVETREPPPRFCRNCSSLLGCAVLCCAVLCCAVQNERRRLSKKKTHDAAQESIRARIRAQPSDTYPDGVCGICFQALNTFGIDDAIVCSCCSITVHQVGAGVRGLGFLFCPVPNVPGYRCHT